MWVLVYEKLLMRQQSVLAAPEASCILGIIKRGVASREREVMIRELEHLSFKEILSELGLFKIGRAHV